ncbi:hypothetical protein [Komarekiella delphini-convector]|uniref:hypothetical protein n=1 Tax=Komarekiella delphini-convector TaxID=3050158 RepID=UPI00177DA0B0|nr:hypothetical protein [Komarekiella delphini-convector]
MTSTQIRTNTKENKSANKKQSFADVDVGSPKVPLRKRNKTKQEHELLSDWEHAS